MIYKKKRDKKAHYRYTVMIHEGKYAVFSPEDERDMKDHAGCDIKEVLKHYLTEKTPNQ